MDNRKPKPVSLLLVDYDADSVISGSSGNNVLWPHIIKRPIAAIMSREWGWQIGAGISLTLGRELDKGVTPLLLGGGHSLSYFAIAEACKRFGSLNILHFDAHHDRYTEKMLCHYSVFYRLQGDYPITIHPVGHRFELDKAAPISQRADSSSPWYVSLDVDYFHPALISSVVHSVHPRDTTEIIPNLDDFKAALESIPGPIVAADVVEWIGCKASESEERFLTNVMEALVAKLEQASC